MTLRDDIYAAAKQHFNKSDWERAKEIADQIYSPETEQYAVVAGAGRAGWAVARECRRRMLA